MSASLNTSLPEPVGLTKSYLLALLSNNPLFAFRTDKDADQAESATKSPEYVATPAY